MGAHPGHLHSLAAMKTVEDKSVNKNKSHHSIPLTNVNVFFCPRGWKTCVLDDCAVCSSSFM